MTISGVRMQNVQGQLRCKIMLRACESSGRAEGRDILELPLKLKLVSNWVSVTGIQESNMIDVDINRHFRG